MKYDLQFFGGRGASSGAGGGYLKEYLKNNPYFQSLNEESLNGIIDSFKNMSKAEQYYYSLTQAEQRAMTDMQTDTRNINQYMSGRRTDFSDSLKEDMDNEIKNMKSAIGKYKLEKPITVYRGMSEAEFNSIKSGGKTDSFKSTSTEKSRADAFNANQGGYTVEYKVSKGARVADVNGAPGANENEFIIDSGVKYKKVTKKSDKYLVVEI